jgi:hypothetical protein
MESQNKLRALNVVSQVVAACAILLLFFIVWQESKSTHEDKVTVSDLVSFFLFLNIMTGILSPIYIFSKTARVLLILLYNISILLTSFLVIPIENIRLLVLLNITFMTFLFFLNEFSLKTNNRVINIGALRSNTSEVSWLDFVTIFVIMIYGFTTMLVV